MSANSEQQIPDAPDARAWLAEHAPEAHPWQVDCVAAAIGAHREGRAVSIQFARRYGRTYARSLIDRFLAEEEQ